MGFGLSNLGNHVAFCKMTIGSTNNKKQFFEIQQTMLTSISIIIVQKKAHPKNEITVKGVSVLC